MFLFKNKSHTAHASVQDPPVSHSRLKGIQHLWLVMATFTSWRLRLGSLKQACLEVIAMAADLSRPQRASWNEPVCQGFFLSWHVFSCGGSPVLTSHSRADPFCLPPLFSQVFLLCNRPPFPVPAGALRGSGNINYFSACRIL